MTEHVVAHEELAKKNIGDILTKIGRKFEIIHVRWFDNKKFEAKFRTISTKEHEEDYNAFCDQWVEDFSKATETIWIHKTSNTGPKVKFRKQYQCWTYEENKIQKELLFDPRKCKGCIDIKILAENGFAKKRLRHFRLGLNVLVIIQTLVNYLLLLFLYFASAAVFCQVENEIFQYDPRVFNPHPYEALVKRQLKKHDPGPVLFPQTPGDDDPLVNNRYNIVNIESIRMQQDQQQQRRQQERLELVNNVDPSGSYKQQNQRNNFALTGEYDTLENEVLDPQIYEELAKHGVKIINFSPQNVESTEVLSSNQKKPFVFSYKVLDRQTGDDFSHRQVQNAKDTKGEYRVQLPDGRLQIVSYTAGKNGFNADVKYIPNGSDKKVDIQRVPVKELRPVLRPGYDYLENGDVTIHEQQLVSPLKSRGGIVGGLEKIAGPTEVPVNYVDLTVTPSNAPLADVTGVSYLRHRLKPTVAPLINYPKALYTTNHKEEFTNYNPASVDPPIYHRKYTSLRYTSTTSIPPPQQSVYTYRTVEPTPITYFKRHHSNVYDQPIPVVHVVQRPIYTTVAPIAAHHASQSPFRHAQQHANYLELPQPTYRPPILNPKPEIFSYGDHGLFNPTDPNYLRQRRIEEKLASSSTTSTTTTLPPIVVADEEDKYPQEHSHKPLILRRRGNGVGRKVKELESIYFIDKAQRDHIKK